MEADEYRRMAAAGTRHWWYRSTRRLLAQLMGPYLSASSTRPLVLDAGGRHYFAKDGRTTAAAIRQGYPRLEEWKAVRDSVDPEHVWQSDLSRRLGLTD